MCGQFLIGASASLELSLHVMNLRSTGDSFYESGDRLDRDEEGKQGGKGRLLCRPVGGRVDGEPLSLRRPVTPTPHS